MGIKLKENILLALFSTFGIGGRARCFIAVRSPEELTRAVRWAEKNNQPYRIFAGGSNVVFPDEGLDCLVIRMFGGRLKIINNKVALRQAQGVIVADAGVLLGDVIKKAIMKGWSGLETLSGIPGTIGGAVVGNAGAYGHSISESVEKVEVLIPKLRKSQIPNSKSQTFDRKLISNVQCEFKYRESVFKRGLTRTERGLTRTVFPIVLRVRLRFDKTDDPGGLRKTSRSIIALREKKYKPGLRCPGSFFKNVLVKEVSKASFKKIDPAKVIDPVRSLCPGHGSRCKQRFTSNGVEGKIPAGYLLEQVGAKGMRAGGIYIADFHGNLFVNDGTGRAADVKKLAEILKKKVKQRFGVKLEEEVRYF